MLLGKVMNTRKKPFAHNIYASMTALPDIEDRLAIRERPEGMYVMHQDWHKLLFLHWEMRMQDLRTLLPEPLQIDTYEGKAWLTVTPLTITNLRPPYLPAIPYLSWLYELNVRTSVHLDGVPGVWFFSLDANHLPAVIGARMFFSLPYYNARIMCKEHGRDVQFWSAREDQKAEFAAAWSIGEDMPPSGPRTLEFFLVERYCLYAEDSGRIYRSRIHHQPWPLQKAFNIEGLRYGVVSADGIPLPGSDPIAHCGGPVFVDVWPPERVR